MIPRRAKLEPQTQWDEASSMVITSRLVSLALAAALAIASLPLPAQDEPTFVFPPKAAEVTGSLDQISLGPIYEQAFTCSDHWFGQLAYAGDALGSDCLIEGMEKGGADFVRPFRTDGQTNEDWFGYGANVLAPVAGTVVGVHRNAIENIPGERGRPPASMVQIRTPEGAIVLLAHVKDIRVSIGDTVSMGQVIASVGNNGMSRAPHVHVGAWREADAVPLQLRWDLRAMAAQFAQDPDTGN